MSEDSPVHDLFYVAGNAFVPTGRVSSTARRGCKWYRDAKVGDAFNLKVTESKESFGIAVLVHKELVTFRDVLVNADHNHTAFNPKYKAVGLPADAALFAELRSAYGECSLGEEFTVLHIIRITGCVGCGENPLSEALDAVDSELAYQLDKLGPEGHDRSIDEWCLYIRDYAEEAAHQATRGDEGGAVHTIRKVATMALVALADNDAPRREGF